MKKWFLHICLFAGCVLSLSSCILDEVVDTDTIETSVELTLSYADGPMSRDVGSKDDALDYTTEAQCSLAIDDIFILAFDQTTDKLLGLVEDLEFVEDNDGLYYTQKIKGRMRPLQEATSVYFAVLTNLNQNDIKDKDGNAVTDLTDFIDETSETIYKNLIYNTSDGQWITNKKRIPMWGKTENATLSNGALINKGCNLYRAIAKVQIWIGNKKGITGPNGDAFKITKITVQNVNNKGYCVSLNNPDSDIYKQYTAASVPGYSSLGNIVYKDLTVTTAYSDEIYLPEHINTGDGATPIKILVEYTYNGTRYTDDKAGVIEFYDADGAYDVIRNHSYIFNITGVSEQVKPELKYQVIDWTDVENPDLYFGNSDGNINNNTVQNQ